MGEHTASKNTFVAITKLVYLPQTHVSTNSNKRPKVEAYWFTMKAANENVRNKSQQTLVVYTTSADDLSLLVTSNAEPKVISKEIRRYGWLAWLKINRDKSVYLQLCSWKDSTLSGTFIWTEWQTDGARYSASGSDPPSNWKRFWFLF